MCSSLLQLAPGSRNLSQAEKENNFKTSIFTENDNFVHPGQILVFDLWICSALQITVILFSAWEKSRDPTVNWSRLEHM